MNPDDAQRDRRALEIFGRALEMDDLAARAGYLGGACDGNAVLKARVEALLAHHIDDNFLQKPAANLLPDATAVVRVTEKPGGNIGRYTLLEALGEGGVGAVWLAEQTKPVRRKVALKVIKPGMDTRQVVARFAAERQALALMDHPNIAKVLDAGTTDAGRPYFVMELVRGIPITKFCDENKLATRERLDLFVKVCHAVQHAHQKGIIHRDLKPSNVLVTRRDGGPVPTVIDFGIAKATQQDLTDKSVHTQFQQFIGTPAYVSPEQAEMSGLDIDTRSDIYSLGVLLYELLTGTTPFEARELLASGLEEMRRTIREKEPLRPSSKLSTLEMAAAAELASQRQEKLPALVNLLRGDLDWIVMKCLEKDRERRYETTNDLAADVQRHLDTQPVLARRPSPLYRARKSIQRNRLAYASALVVVAALIGGLCMAIWGLMREREARHQAEFARQQAEAARQQAEAARNVASAESARNEQIAKFFMGGWGPALWRDQDPAFARRFLDRMSAGVQLALSSQPAAQGDLWVGIGNSYAAINDFPTAITNLQLAVRAYQTAFGTQHVRLALAVAQLGRLHRQNQDDQAARTNAQLAVEIARRCNDPETLADCLLNAAKSYTGSDHPPPEAIPILREAMDLRRHAVPHMLALLDSTRLLVKALEGLAAEGRLDEAKAILEAELKVASVDGDLRKLRRKLAP